LNIVVFGPEHRVGVLAGEYVVDLAIAGTVYASATRAPLPADLGAFIEAGPDAITSARNVVALALATPAEKRAEHGVYARSDVTLQAPHVRGARIVCAGGNFADHAAKMSTKRANAAPPPDLGEFTKQMRARGIWGFWKVGRDAAGPDGQIEYPARTQRFDYEGELAIVIGKRAKDVGAGDLRAYVFGMTLFVDWSIRDLDEGSATFKYAAAKNFDGSFSIGPVIVVDDGIDYENTSVQTWVNGEIRQDYNTRDMVVKFGEYLEYLSKDFTFYPGDIITGGTAAGTAADSSDYANGAFAPERFLKVGDVVDVRSPQIGTLSSRVVAKRLGPA